MSAPPGTLYVVATPIGNLEDLSGRAVDVLRAVPLVLCEDTRHSGGLLRHLGASPRLLSLHAHNEQARISGVLAHLRGGEDAALISDAGTPCLSDPGVRVVDATHEAALPVVSVSGPFAAAVALAGAGLATASFSFWGFLPKKSAARRTALVERLTAGPGGEAHSHVVYLPGRDIDAVCLDLEAVAPNARIAIARELTKIHEQYLRGTATEVLAQITAAAARGENKLRGEAVLIVEMTADTVARTTVKASADELLKAALLTDEDRKTALRRIAKETGKSRRLLYARWIELASEAPSTDE